MMSTMVPSVFHERQVRRILHDNELWFVMEDICSLMLEQQNGKSCWSQLRKSLEQEGCDVTSLSRFLPFHAFDGARQELECATLEGIFRILQSISTNKAEVFKRWLAQLGTDQVTHCPPQTNLAAVFTMLEDAAAKSISLRNDCREDESMGKARKCAAQIADEARANLRMESTIKLLDRKK